ncbi:MAG: hypothetical protein A2508_03255 [Candidatus Lambdaproteobacteria bacterium RIFOXYD12_FULL_49_8]|uniref:Uncharacterized protein n=1 Tax=Candidatus Lambdaproteobacteria bacterium RIFOXYD2_FULL_50_16 TaxID=1817772 RepID=A0A1F6G598_9PROT|nr:MAG: hypothetical protein A2527_13650 [Candidatus Lambdaproteobacteria bacterium RIFOXYD2_FULL_50_16]OGG97567.1 MAG: hypothetical protein A2508_03255 [Candidatus Lambdaproteobacteria bacterium RIFOXYD12_FULL_49_8]
MSHDLPFWKYKALARLSKEEWESLCDGCGLCCLKKVIYEEPFEVKFTQVACRYLDPTTCKCRDYGGRFNSREECLPLTLEHIKTPGLMPKSCAYQRIYEGAGLADWHPLLSGDPDTVHQAGISLSGQMISEEGINDEDLEKYFLQDQPNKSRRRKKRKA